MNPIARMAAFTSSSARAAEKLSAAQPAPPPASSTPAQAPAPQPAAPSTATSPRPTVVGRLAHVPATQLWASDQAFASWLAKNLDALGEAVSAKLTAGQVPHPETPVVLASQPSGGAVVIVCELGGASDEGFGRLVRNVAASNAKHAIWVSGEPGPEYGAAVSWLNRTADGRFAMVKVRGVTIGESAAAPMFELEVRTSRTDDPGVESSTPGAVPDKPVRRVDDWLNSVGAGGDQGQT